jgi:hypothetical protein
VGDSEILETYLNSASKNTSETDIFAHGTKSLLNSVINKFVLDLFLCSFINDYSIFVQLYRKL